VLALRGRFGDAPAASRGPLRPRRRSLQSRERGGVPPGGARGAVDRPGTAAAVRGLDRHRRPPSRQDLAQPVLDRGGAPPGRPVRGRSDRARSVEGPATPDRRRHPHPLGSGRMSTPAVSVIVPAYNAEAWIARAVDSALNQTFRDLEVVVCDDGSTDGTARILDAYRDPRLRVLRHDNRGRGAARNAAMAAARGRDLALLDADVWWLPEKLAELGSAHV